MTESLPAYVCIFAVCISYSRTICIKSMGYSVFRFAFWDSIPLAAVRTSSSLKASSVFQSMIDFFSKCHNEFYALLRRRRRWLRYIPWFCRATKFWFTPPKFNIAPEKLPSQKVSSLPTIHFQGLCQTSGGKKKKIAPHVTSHSPHPLPLREIQFWRPLTGMRFGEKTLHGNKICGGKGGVCNANISFLSWEQWKYSN